MRSARPSACEATLEIDSGPASAAIAEALEPDNRQAPPGVRVSCRAESYRVVCRVEVDCGDSRGILRLRNTIDDLLSSARAALESLRAAGGEA
ncbi:MAG: hypothetical protein LRS49_04165 [Desulfurococcales archaeon]|nr:hypothetical protein [Desulfurococcales archaeon]